VLKYIRTSWLHLVLVYLAVLLDGAIALNAAPVLFKIPMSASPFLTLIVLLMPVVAGVRSQMSDIIMYGAAFAAGLLFDLFYNGVLGIAMIGFPITVLIATLVQKYFQPSFWSGMATWFVALSVYLIFDYMAFGVINLASLTIPGFIMFHLFPSLLINLLLYIIVYAPLTKLYEATKQPDVSAYESGKNNLTGQFPVRLKK
jgi:rod shape-determining protein MreD